MVRRPSVGAVCSAALVGSMACTAAVAAAEVTRRCWAMGAWLELVATAPDPNTAVAASEAAVRAVEGTEQRLSTWRDDSELSRLNRSRPGDWVELSPQTARDLAETVAWWQLTDGHFSPGVASLVRAWDLRGSGRVPSLKRLEAAVRASRMDALELAATAARRLDGDFGIEEGGFGKGAALREAAEAGHDAGADCLWFDFGGQVHLFGDCDPVQVGLADPRHRDVPLATLTVAGGSLATSGNSERRLPVGDVRVGHLLDPRSGRPAADFGSVTVLAADPVAADCASTALYVMGTVRGAMWLRDRKSIEAIFSIDLDDRVLLVASRGLMDRITILDPRVELRSIDAVQTKSLEPQTTVRIEAHPTAADAGSRTKSLEREVGSREAK